MRVTTLTMMHMSVFLLLVSSASASHYYGGFLTFTPKGLNPDGSLTVEILYREAYRICFPYQTWYCYSGNCGITTRSVTGQIASYSGPSYSWCQLETILIKNVPTDSPFEMREASCCWIYAPNNNAQWNLFAHIDLGTRSDTGKPNSSPVTTILPAIRVPQNCQRELKLLAHDPDADVVRCRYGILPNIECGTCYQHPDFFLDENSCTLTHFPTAITGTHVFELVLEDYPEQSIGVSHRDGTQLPRYPWTSYSQTTTSSPWQWFTSTTTSTPWQWFTSTTTSTPWQWFTSTTTSMPWLATTTISPPSNALSSIPLQFIVQVDQSVPSCADGEYLPMFQSPTPEHGKIIYAAVNYELAIKVKAAARFSTLTNIFISGPLNITKVVNANGNTAEAVIKWTPGSDGFGEHFPVCFVAESVLGSSFYNSEMRCVVIVVGHTTGEATVSCNEMTMTVEIEKASIPGLNDGFVRLKDPLCTLMSNSTHIIGTMSLNTCGTEIEEDDESIIFKNEIVSFENTSTIITRTSELNIGFSCKYPKKGKASFSFTVHKPPYVFTENGFGTFAYQFELFTDRLFNSMVDPSAYPPQVNLGEMIYMQIAATSPILNTVLYVDSCRATPYDDPNYPVFYSIIENGCIVDNTVVVYENNNTMYKFGMEAFKFIGLHERVYITCSVILCEAGNHTRCSQGCVNGTATPAPHYRRRRAAITETSSHFISQGP
uniref:ZP domain-containing protein-like n=1 Tax=Scleropages formosus TaxID=113540 RepID=A0A8C9TN35_SCLFO